MGQTAPPSNWPAGVDRVILEEVDSTSLEAARRAPTTPTWILARRQSAAKGRRGRAWSMPEGNFAASLVWRPAGDPASLPLRSFTASLALYDALRALGVEGLSLKWPNDVLLDDRKLAGILLEAPVPGLLVLGIGLNLIAAPDVAQLEPGAVAPISLLSASGLRVEATALLDVLAPAFAEREAQLTTWGFAPIRTEWMKHAARVGQPITARLVNEVVEGLFVDVDDDGRLVLETEQGVRRITAGDVFFGRG
ncbi:BirA family transcriptional regulator, biotin operon repressor / biotin-[acetyl-CoA-carboxylase] ligase [Jannaschia faecimaris]|uniref:biotin--[biotin carboxyl-carrier protein] ligase n=1 Tax=Jannaschia faecimaris TaxID=1244108 RepID=A0A1H3PT97_9RHOB|nr:biotin--[acetyl-CoA-carboxylase] ligase [Jannaschia faecimaris]SDZ03629.1 BirA family transcriptional regulator, biotin operon repressor / biotin-[acetyl-CoA-carboxylase] ligase [Jannaschia faecimaris]